MPDDSRDWFRIFVIICAAAAVALLVLSVAGLLSGDSPDDVQCVAIGSNPCVPVVNTK